MLGNNVLRQVCSKIGRAALVKPRFQPRLVTLAPPFRAESDEASSAAVTAGSVEAMLTGVTQIDYKESLMASDYFGVKEMVTVEDLFRARVHFGHKVGTLNGKMKTFLFGERLQVCIFNLDKTLFFLRQALNFVAHVAFRGGIILFVASDRQNMHLIEKVARDCGEYSHCRKWQNGTFTNSTTLFGCQIRLPDLIVMTRTLTSVSELHPVVTEAAKMLIPVVAVVDSNCDPNLITFPIPGNDDSPPAIALYLRLFAEAIKRGKTKREELLKSLS